MKSDSTEVVTAIRRRPGMYVGEWRDGSGLTVLLFEVIANVLDLWFRGQASELVVTLLPGRAEVADDGPGLAEHPSAFLEEVLTVYHNSPTADGHAPHFHLNRMGLGLLLVNALCEAVVVQTTVAEGAVEQRFGRGLAQGPATRLARAVRGTVVRMMPDPEIFPASAGWDLPGITRRLREVAASCPGLVVRLQVEGKGFREAHVFGPFEGLHGLLASRAGIGVRLHPDVIRCAEVDGTLACDVGLQWWSEPPEPQISSWCNLLPTQTGGSHVIGLHRGIQRALGVRPSKARGRVLLTGLHAVVGVTMIDPTFAHPTQDCLTSLEAGRLVERVVATQLASHLEQASALASILRARLGTDRRSP